MCTFGEKTETMFLIWHNIGNNKQSWSLIFSEMFSKYGSSVGKTMSHALSGNQV